MGHPAIDGVGSDGGPFVALPGLATWRWSQLDSAVHAECDSRKTGEGHLIGCENRPLRGQGSGCDHEIMSTSGPALPPDKDKELRVGVGDL